MAHHFDEVDGKPHRVDDGAVNLGIAVDVEKKDGSADADGPGHPRRRPPVVHRLQGRVRRPHRQGAREQADRRRPHRREHLADQPGRHRHDRLGPAAHDRPGHDRRDRLDRLPGRPRQHRRDDRRREGHDDDLDLRPPDHPGRGVGPVPADRRGVPPGRARLLRGRLRVARRRSSARRRRRPAPAAAAAAAREAPAGRRAPDGRADEELLQAVQAATSLRQGAPHARPPRRASSTRSAPSPRATRRSTPSRSA